MRNVRKYCEQGTIAMNWVAKKSVDRMIHWYTRATPIFRDQFFTNTRFSDFENFRSKIERAVALN